MGHSQTSWTIFLEEINCIMMRNIPADINLINSRTPRDLRHFGNPKNENLPRSPKFYEENEFLVEMCRSQLSRYSVFSVFTKIS